MTIPKGHVLGHRGRVPKLAVGTAQHGPRCSCHGKAGCCGTGEPVWAPYTILAASTSHNRKPQSSFIKLQCKTSNPQVVLVCPDCFSKPPALGCGS